MELSIKRGSKFSKAWMLPSSHLIIYESPHDAAKRILKEQPELDNLKLNEPKVIS
ncbi:MAG TPA: hypothetical protein VJZ03_00860 [Candidatus Bathyarchaeia archaeon]|nr:hypothetical protein [Candidatus Bathyarchaeia archaeon]